MHKKEKMPEKKSKEGMKEPVGKHAGADHHHKMATHHMKEHMKHMHHLHKMAKKHHPK